MVRSPSPWRYRSLPALLALTLLAPLGLVAGIAAAQHSDAQASAQPRPQARAVERLAVETKDGRRHVFRAELAATPKTRARGLMFRRALDPDAGMLFLYPGPRRASMWMKNTFISLDMLFIRADGVIAKIVERTEPQSLDLIGADTPVTAVLELAGGTAHRLGLSVGDRVHHRAFASGGT